MTWTRISDDFHGRPEILRVSRSARLLHIEGQTYSNTHGTDGRIPTIVLPRISDSDDLDRDTTELAGVGLWNLSTPDEWQIDMRDQEPAAVVRDRQQAQADKQRRYRERKARHERGDHGDCDPRYCRVTSNKTSDKTSRVTGPLPTPSRPTPKGVGQDGQRCPGGHPVATDGTCGCGVAHEASA